LNMRLNFNLCLFFFQHYISFFPPYYKNSLKLITSLSSTVRRVKALIKLSNCPIFAKILRPDARDSIFWLNNNVGNRNWEQESRSETVKA
jgi:hypothetical protein